MIIVTAISFLSNYMPYYEAGLVNSEVNGAELDQCIITLYFPSTSQCSGQNAVKVQCFPNSFYSRTIWCIFAELTHHLVISNATEVTGSKVL